MNNPQNSGEEGFMHNAINKSKEAIHTGWEKTKEVSNKAGEKIKEGYNVTKEKASEMMHKNKTPEKSEFDHLQEQPNLSNQPRADELKP
ncbi:hypothetical protein PPL_07692 [Heterostelium album PN500]|uniref:Uncharacterized protein n=1 Tax=Heterostelium pallidum (strain ATCC 26659 / Pp 5 / PN500) TaxID=670386 RepID=D3BGP0_HETP5|nr:hypothetical protein PPL_07692 [Heterostelium album PN500]EFA79274.1 hypothetical protein PPL_07692 [Heterostelium album PN500]|eukprot:XP_020431395.1 hypothetical protein PPL_07692 [Heterostelium album PN500]